MPAWSIELTPENLLIATLAALALGLLVGYLIARVQTQRGIRALEAERVRLETELEAARALGEAQLKTLQEARNQLNDSFAALSQQALRHNSEEFLKLARENLGRFQSEARSDLDKREQSIEGLVKPIRETLQKTEQQIQQMEKERREAFGSLSQHLQLMAEGQRRLQKETQNLVTALRRPEVRGQWGEMTLKRLAELAGMVEHCDFYEQESRSGPEGALRPDMVVRMPDQRELVVDAKTPLDAYLSAIEAENAEERAEHLRRHARKLRERMRELASKAYWSQFKHSPDFVVLFVPGDQFLSAALEQDAALLEDAISNKVILATPTSIIALLRAVAFGWRQQVLAENAEKIRELGEELYRRLASFTDHLTRLGKGLGSSVDYYNKAVGSLERQVLPGARKFTELGIHSKRAVDEPGPLEQTPRLPVDNE
ncbi:MAG: DNA recombination protein RmuC [Chromatiales bacterium]|jgi:DNA recombination protein RmuC